MRKTKFTESQILNILKELDSGVKVADLHADYHSGHARSGGLYPEWPAPPEPALHGAPRKAHYRNRADPDRRGWFFCGVIVRESGLLTVSA